MAIDEVHNRIDPVTRPELPRSATQTREEVVSEEYDAGGSIAEAIGGLAATVLAIVALAGAVGGQTFFRRVSAAFSL